MRGDRARPVSPARRAAWLLVFVLVPPTTACDVSTDGARVRAAAVASDSSLRRRAAELLPGIEERAALPARRPIALAERRRGELESFIEAQLTRQLPPDRLRAVERTYVRLGLLPDGVRLDSLLRALLLEQVVGYYDPARDTLYVREGLPPELVEPVLVHEIVHALQDQHLDLDSLAAANLARNDVATAAQSALEGFATLVMVEWQLDRLTQGTVGLEALPDLDALPEEALYEMAGLEMPALVSAPRVVREALIFPYFGGLRFARATAGSSAGGPALLGSRMPVSTEQVLHPERAIGTDRDDPFVVEIALPASGWDVVHSDGLGELETRVWLRELLGDRPRAEEAAAGWDGDRYLLLKQAGGEALLWASAWDSDRDADEFAAAARDALAGRYAANPSRATRVDVVRGLPAPVVVVVDVPRPVRPETLVPAVKLLPWPAP